MSRQLRTFTAFQRQVSRSHYSSYQNGNVRVQRVRMLRPSFRNRFLPRAIFLSVAISFLWSNFNRRENDDGEVKEAPVSMKEAVDQVRAIKQTGQVAPGGETSIGTEEEVEAVSEGEDEEEWEEEELVPEKQPDDAWFIPLWFARTVPTVNYTAEDEEFQIYAQFNDNPALVSNVKRRLLEAIFQVLANSPQFQRSLGAPIQIGKRWIDVLYPAGPPPEYERLGIEVTDDYVALLHRPVEQRNYERLNNALYPMAAAQSLWLSTRTVLGLHAAKWAQRFGGGEFQEKGDAMVEKFKAMEKAHSTTTPKAEEPASDSSKESKDSRQVTSLPLPKLPQPNEDLRRAVFIFRRWYAQKNVISASPPRGTILLQGTVELVGKHGLCVVGVQALYDPKEKKFPKIIVSPKRPTRRKLTPHE